MQIIAGTHKGRKLTSLPGKSTRPTSGKVREAIFNICSGLIKDATVLDLYAGTGAFGLEAISRGAATVVFVDSDRKSAAVIRKNIDICGENDRSTVICGDILLSPTMFAATGNTFDLVFMDPPYDTPAIRQTLENLVQKSVLKKGAILIVEHDKYEEIPEDIPGLEITDKRKYGKTFVTFMNYL